MKFASYIAALALTGSVAMAGSPHGADWGYMGEGDPQHWGALSPDYVMCDMGKNQSPINITHSVEAGLPSIKFNYTSSPVGMINNGHTVQINIGSGSTITVDGIDYELKQYHFHTPSENQIHGKSFPLEAHFVHADAKGNLAVVAVMFEVGEENKQLQELWRHMPLKPKTMLGLEGDAKDINKLIPEDPHYYRFSGSLTTPPCTEGVKWFVMKQPLTISKEQVGQFSHCVHGHNNRPIQPYNAREVIE